MRVVTDSYRQSLEPSGKLGELAVQRYQRPPSPDLPRTLQNEWGLSLDPESARGAETRQTLVDFGFTGDTLNNNLDLLSSAVSPVWLFACYPCGRARSRLNLLASEAEVSCPKWVSTSRPSAP